MPQTRQVYLLDPKDLSPETIAVTFAKTSRSPQRFCEIAAELSDEKSAEFNEKWVVGYGHASVAEHAVLHLAVENISRLAVEALESCRLASYTEKSTRYQKWSTDAFYTPENLTEPGLKADYQSVVKALFKAYQEALPAVKAVVENEYPLQDHESAPAWERRIRSAYVDICRYYLPAAALANVGVTINARALEHSLTKMLSHPLAEVRAIGAELKQVSQANVPTLVKYADQNSYLESSRKNFRQVNLEFELPAETPELCHLIECSPGLEENILAAALYSQGTASYAQTLQRVQQASQAQKQSWADMLLGSLGSFDIPLRELEYGDFTFEVCLDQGGYFELKRHRMMTQTPQRFTPALGYALPLGICQAGLEEHFHQAMQLAGQAYQQLSVWDADAASYVLPNAYNRRVLLKLNFRALLHLLNLRSAANAHFSIRRLSQAMAAEVRARLPLLGQYLRVNPEEDADSITQAYFRRV